VEYKFNIQGFAAGVSNTRSLCVVAPETLYFAIC